MKRLYPLFALFFLTAISLYAQPVRSTTGTLSTGVDPERLKRVDEVIQSFVQEGKVVGAVALVIKDGNVLVHKGYGIDNRDTKKSMQADAIFRIASQTKAITSVGILLLMEEGKLLLSDPVHRYIPTFKNMQVVDTFNPKDSTYTTVPAKRDITIKDLLTHTAGLGYPSIGSPMMQAIYAKNGISAGIGDTQGNMAESMLRLGKLPLELQPGTRWNYGLNTDVLGHIIELVSGMSLEDFFRKRICEPLGMKDTWFTLPKDLHARLSAIYMREQAGVFTQIPETGMGMAPDFPKYAKSYFSGGAGLSSTASDYAAFLQMILNKGVYKGKQLLSPRSVELLLSNQVGDMWGGKQFGLGFGIVGPADAEMIRNAGTFYWGGAFGTNYWVDPKQKLVALLLTQQFGAGPELGELQEKFNVAIYQALR